jgi:phage terminase large subunit-like protein
VNAPADWPPRWLTPVPDEAIRAGDGADVADFIEATCRVTMDSIAAPYGTPLVLRHFQTKLIERLFARDPATGLKRHRVALVGVARKNGKSALLAAIALYELFYGQRGGQVYVVAGTRDQARIIFETAKQMVRMERDHDSRRPHRPFRT